MFNLANQNSNLASQYIKFMARIRSILIGDGGVTITTQRLLITFSGSRVICLREEWREFPFIEYLLSEQYPQFIYSHYAIFKAKFNFVKLWKMFYCYILILLHITAQRICYSMLESWFPRTQGKETWLWRDWTHGPRPQRLWADSGIQTFRLTIQCSFH